MRDTYKSLFSSELATLTTTKRKLLAQAYIDQFSNINIPMLGSGDEFWVTAQIPWMTRDYVVAGIVAYPQVDERRIPARHIEIARNQDVELELYELQARINFCQYLLEIPDTGTVETYDRLIKQVNYTVSDAMEALFKKKPDEVIIIVKEPFVWVGHSVKKYGNSRYGSRARGVLYFRNADAMTDANT